MIKKTIIKNGKKYIVNAPGWNDDVGPGAPAGTLWMRSVTDNSWYVVTLTGTSASAALSINKTASVWQSPGQELGYQLVLSNNGNVYQVYLSGSAGNITSKTAVWPIVSDYKPYLWLKSTDGNYYNINISASSIVVDQNSKWAPSYPNSIPPYSLYY